MNVSLTPELKHYVNEKIQSGMYQTASEVVREALRLLRQRDKRFEDLRRDVKDGFDAVARGEFTDYDENTVKELADAVKSRVRKRLKDEEFKTGMR